MRPGATRRDEIAAWIHEKKPELATTYRAAISMLGSQPLEGHERTRVLFICHAMREVMNRLPAATLLKQGTVDRSDVERHVPTSLQVRQLPKLRINHPDMDLMQDAENVPVPAPAASALSRLIDAATFEDQRRLSDLAAFLTDDGNPKSPAVKEWRDLSDYFVKWAHLHDKSDGELPTDAELSAKIGVFDDHVDAMRLVFFESKSLIEDILSSANRKVGEAQQ
jgi:hypothetical protein